MSRKKKRTKDETKPTRIKKKNLEKIEKIQDRYGIDSKAEAIDYVFRQYRKQAQPPEEWLKDELFGLQEQVDGENEDLKLLLTKFRRLVSLRENGRNVDEALSSLINDFETLEGVE